MSVQNSIKNKFHTLTVDENTLYFTELYFETQSGFSKIPTINREVYRRKSYSDEGIITVKGYFTERQSDKAQEIISALDKQIRDISIDGTTYEKRTLESAVMKRTEKNLLGTFEIRLVKSYE